MKAALDLYFPNKFGSSSSRNQFLVYKGYLKSVLNYLGDKNDAQLKRMEKAKTQYETTIHVPLLSNRPESDEINILKEHALMNVNLQKQGVSDPDKFTTLEFFTLVDQMEKQQQELEAKKRKK